MDDKFACAELIQAWAIYRDQGKWPQLLSTFLPEGEIAVSWFSGSFREFVDRCRQSFEAGQRSKHHIFPSVVRVARERALAETSIVILVRQKIGDVLTDITSHARFVDRLERRGERWAIAERVAVYERDRLDPVEPSEAFAKLFGATDLSAYPEPYRYMAARLKAAGRAPAPVVHYDGAAHTAHLYARYGAPVYVRHEIVHNRYVVESLKAKGAIFVEELDEIPDTDAPVIFSAHGVPKSIPSEAQRRNLFALDATCPLVTKVHREAEIHHKRGREIVLIGHAGHPEVVGTLGQLPSGAITLVQSVEEVARFVPRDPSRLAYVTQTTLSVDDTAGIVAALKARFPQIHGPHKEDICYATTNRQEVVKKVAPMVEAMVVVGSPNSSNTQRLKEVAERAGCPRAALVQRAGEIDWSLFGSIASLGVTAGASAPEVLVEEVIGAFAERYAVKVETVTTADEDMFFPLPRVLRGPEAAE